MDLKERFGNLVAVNRRRLGLSQRALAEATGMSENMISRIERGDTGTRFSVIEKIAEALSVDPSAFFLGAPIETGSVNKALIDLNSKLAGMSEGDLLWITSVVDAAMRRR